MENTYLVAGAIVVIGIIYTIIILKGKTQQTAPDYRMFFYMGLIFLPIGISNPPLLILSIVFITIGLLNKDKWKPEPKWSELPKVQKNLKIGFMVALGLLIIAGFIMWYFGSQNKNQNSETLYTKQVTSFEECIAVGNPAMESYPRQCRHKDETFVEDIAIKIDADSEPILTQEEAILIAGKTSECTMVGIPKNTATYNNNSKTWWINLERMPELENDGCNPACVVREENKTAEVNWRCTGAILK